MLLVAITCTENDYEKNYARIRRSVRNFTVTFDKDVFFLLVYQTKQGRVSKEGVFDGVASSNFEIFAVDYLSVSRARNESIAFAKHRNCDFIIFHDSSLVYTSQYVSWMQERLTKNQLISTKYKFTDDLTDVDSKMDERLVQFDDFADIFVCSYVFPMSATFPLFDLRFGPGEASTYESGEDFLFLREFFKSNRHLKRFLRFEGNGILHPPRPKNLIKHLAYAEGQGKIHQIYLCEEKSLYAMWRCALFFGNALFRVVLFRKNAIRILGLRIKGFLDTKVKV